MKTSNIYKYVAMGKRTLPLSCAPLVLRRFAESLFTFLLCLCACSEADDSVEEYPNWKENNETYWQNLYETTKQKINAGDTSWKLIPKYSYTSESELSPSDYVIAHVKEVGEGTVSPIYTDTVRVHYRGHLLPSTSYSAGYQFDTSYTGDLNTAVATPSKFAVSGVVSGWTSALQKMHVGDRWDLYVPYQLGYGKTTSGSIPAYSTLVFDVMLVQFWHAGEQVVDFK